MLNHVFSTCCIRVSSWHPLRDALPSSFRDFPLARARDAVTWAPGAEDRCGFLWHSSPSLSSAAIQIVPTGPSAHAATTTLELQPSVFLFNLAKKVIRFFHLSYCRKGQQRLCCWYPYK